MKNKFIIPIVALAVIVIIAVSMLFLFGKMPVCKSMYNEIEKELEDSNYCTQDSDCDSIALGGFYIEFGCYHYINKNVDKEVIYQKMEKYSNKGCTTMIDKCARAPPAICSSGKCASSNP